MILGDDFIPRLLFLLFLFLVFIIGCASGLVSLFAVLGKAKMVAKVAGIIGGICFAIIGVAYVDSKSEDWQRSADKRAAARARNRAKTPLLRAIDALDEAKVVKLIAKGADVNKCVDGRSPLTAAISQKAKQYEKTLNALEISDRIVAHLLEAGADPNQRTELLKRDPWYMVWSDIELVRWDFMPPLPISIAIENKRTEALKLLIKHGVIIDSVDFKKYDEMEAQGLTVAGVFPKECVYDFFPVQWALREYSYDCMEILLEAGARATVWYNEGNNETLLMRLLSRNTEYCEETALRILDLLVDYYEKMPNMKDADGNTALHYYAKDLQTRKSQNPLVARLVERGADINAVNNEGKTPLMCAVMENCIWGFSYLILQLQTLIDAGADITKKDSDGKRALELFHEYNAKKDIYQWDKESVLAMYAQIEAMLTPKTAETLPLAEPAAVAVVKPLPPAAAESPAAPKSAFAAGTHLMLNDMEDNW